MGRLVHAVLGFVAAVGLMAPAASTALAQEGGADTFSACSLLSKDEIRQIAGADRIPSYMEQFQPREEKLSGGGSECATHAGIQVQLDAYPIARFEEVRKVYAARTTFERIEGVGDEAYFYEQDVGKEFSHRAGIYARVGEHVLVISMSVKAPDTAESLRPIVLALSKAAAGKLA